MRGKKRGFGKCPAQPPAPLPPEPADPGDLGRLNPEQRKRFDLLLAMSAGFPDGIRPPDPEFIQRLDREIEEVRNAFATNHYNARRAAEKLGVTHEELMDYLARRPELYDAIGDPREELVNRAEIGLRAAVDDKQPWAVCFVLQTLGRSRGYSENPHDEIPRKPPASPHAIDPSRLTYAQMVEMTYYLSISLGIEPEDISSSHTIDGKPRGNSSQRD